MTRQTLLLDFKSHNDTISANFTPQRPQKLHMKFKNKFRDKLRDSIILQHTSCPHVTHGSQNQLNAKLKYCAYGPDLLPCIFMSFCIAKKKAFKVIHSRQMTIRRRLMYGDLGITPRKSLQTGNIDLCINASPV